MKFAEPLESQRLSFLLEKAASKEARMWKAYVPKKGLAQVQDTDISHDQRDEAVRWLTALHSKLHLYPDTLSLAICILDRFLASIKARPKYLRCIAIACFFLATKTSEEDERVPLLQDLVSSSSCGCSPSEILRMERIILDKLSWDLHAATPLDFLQIFHAMVHSCKSPFLVGLLGLNPSQHMALLTQRLHRCLADHALLQFRGSMLALALITLELETCCPDWLALTIDLLRKAQIDSSQLIRCRELVAQSLSTSQASLPPNTVYIYQPLHQSLVPRNQGGPVGAPYPGPQHQPRNHPAGTGAHTGPLVPPPSWLPSSPTTTTPISTPPATSPPALEAFLQAQGGGDGGRRLLRRDQAPLQRRERPGRGAGEGLGCGVRLVWHEGSTSPCPPLQPVSVT